MNMGELDQVFDNYSKKIGSMIKKNGLNIKNKKSRKYMHSLIQQQKKLSKMGEEFKKYLDTNSKFEQYSVANNLLITAQMPEATVLRDYDSWTNVGGFPKKNRKNDVKILEPADSYMRDDGSVGTNYNVKYLTDISQVNIRRKQNPMRYDNRLLLKVFLNSSQAKVEIVDRIPETDRGALYDSEKDVLYIARGAEVPKIFHEVTQELAKQEIGEKYRIRCFSKLIVYLIWFVKNMA